MEVKGYFDENKIEVSWDNRGLDCEDQSCHYTLIISTNDG
jgi:hypothetical protein